MTKDTDPREERELRVLAYALGLALLVGVLAGCTRTVYVAGPDPAPEASAIPAPAAETCRSVPRAEGDCYVTSEDRHLAAVEAAHDVLEATLYRGEIQGGAAYIEGMKTALRAAGLCAKVYENEEVAVWRPGDGFSENYDVIAEPGDGRLLPRRGPGSHSWSCRPPTAGE
jgi:hypothetical protein